MTASSANTYLSLADKVAVVTAGSVDRVSADEAKPGFELVD